MQKQFYDSSLKDALKELNGCSADACSKIKSNLLTEKQQLEEKQKKCQDAISSCEKCIFDKEQKVEILKKKIKDQKIKALSLSQI